MTTDYAGSPIPPDQAWRTFDDWQSRGCEIGVIFLDEPARALFNLALANFRYGPPIVEMTAIRAALENGDCLIFADGLLPQSLPQRALAQ